MGSHRIRKITVSTGIITTVAGTVVGGNEGDGGPATSAALNYPVGVSVDGAGNIYIADSSNRIRKVTASTGIISTVAGISGAIGSTGDGGPATAAKLYYPYKVKVDSDGNLYIADTWNHKVRKVTASTGIITTMAGNGTAGFSGDAGAASSASLNYPKGIAIGAGQLYIADTNNNRIRSVVIPGPPKTTASSSGYTFGAWTKTAAINVTLAATDPDGIAAGYPKYCIDTANTCTPATAYSTPFAVSCTVGTACTKYVRFFAQDNVGSTETVKSVTVKQDAAIPIGTLAINDNAAYSSSANVTLKLTASDNLALSGYYKSNVSNTPLASATGWVAFASGTKSVTNTISHSLSAGSGVKTVYVWLKDHVGNISNAIADTIVYDVTKPTGTVSINGGAAYAKSANVTLALSAADNYKVAAYYKSNLSNAPLASSGDWVAVTQAASVTNSVSHTLTAGSGTKTVYVWFKDTAGNISNAVSDSIAIDAVVPSGTMKINSGAAMTNSTSVKLALTATDNIKIASYFKSNEATAPTASTAGWVAVAAGTTTSVTNSISHTMTSGSGLKTVYVWIKDAAGNISNTISDTITLDNTKPTGKLIIGTGTGYTNTSTVSLNVRGTDNTTIYRYYKSNLNNTPSATATGWTNVTAAASISERTSHTLTSGVGTKAVYMWLRDSAGNISNTIANTVVYDNVAPVNGTVTATAGTDKIDLTMSGFSDATAGIAKYLIATSPTSTPTTCVGTTTYTAGTTYSDTGLVTGDKRYYRVCAVDRAGNISSGAIASASIAPSLAGDWRWSAFSAKTYSYQSIRPCNFFLDPGCIGGGLPITMWSNTDKWIAADISVEGSGVITCSSLTSSDNDSCSLLDLSGKTLTARANRTIINSPSSLINTISAGNLNPAGDTMTWLATTGVGKELSVLYKSGPSYTQADASGQWDGYGIAHYASNGFIFEMNQSFDSSGNATCQSFYNDAYMNSSCNNTSIWEINNLTVAQEGSITMSGSQYFTGGAGEMNPAKDVMTITYNESSASFNTGLFIKQGGTFIQSDLAGTWMAYVLVPGESAYSKWYSGRLTIDSLGNVTCAAYIDDLGTTGCGNWTIPSLLIDSDGRITNMTGGRGRMNMSKDTAVLVMGENSASTFAILSRLK